MVCGYQCYNLLQKVSGFNDVLRPICKAFKCVTPFQISRKNKKNWTGKKLFWQPFFAGLGDGGSVILDPLKLDGNCLFFLD